MSDKQDFNRRRFLQLGAGAVGGAAAAGFFPGLIEQALAISPNNPTGRPGLADIEHVVILMQENRAFDHYFGSLPGVRGYGDPRPMPLPSGNYVWYQPEGTHPGRRNFCENVSWDHWLDTASWYQPDLAVQARDYVLPFRLNQPGDVQYQYLKDLDHDWKRSQDLWSNWNAWVPLKSRESMGFLNADDLPFYYRMAEAFTVCDNYHASLFGPTNPNRVYLFSGTCDRPFNFPESIGGGGANIRNDVNTILTPAMYGQSAAARAATIKAGLPDWKTFAETLTDHGITWKVFQEEDNFDGDGLQFFKNFRIDNHGVPINESTDPYFRTLYLRGRVFAAATGKKDGGGVQEEFAAAVAAGPEPDDPPLGTVRPGLPRVSWIVPTWECSEHPSNAPGHGAAFTASLLRALIIDHPDVFSKTAFLLMYDENDGFFDHVPSPVPPVTAHYGQMTLADAGKWEVYDSVPKGLGPRVPMMIISPWTAGGRVDSQLADHTSVLMFLEKWLAAKGLGRGGPPLCREISAWRRSVCGDLVEAFDFSQPAKKLQPDLATHFNNGTVEPAVPVPQRFPPQAPRVRLASSVPSRCRIDSRALQDGLTLRLAATGAIGAAFMACWWPMSAAQKVLQYTVEAGKTLDTTPIASRGGYDCEVRGPNGYLREFRGTSLGRGVPEVTTRTSAGGRLLIELDNRDGERARRFLLSDNAYAQNAPTEALVPAGATRRVAWKTASGWYDASVRLEDDLAYLRRLAGCVSRSGDQAMTDPAIGNRQLFRARVSARGTRYETLRFDYVTPPWSHHAGNWLGVFPHGAKPIRVNLVRRVSAPRGVGSSALSSSNGGPLAPGAYEVWYFHGNGDMPIIAKGVPFRIAG